MKVFLAALILVAFGVFAMCFNIIFLKKDFPKSDVGENENMRKMGIRCMKEVDDELFLGGGKASRKDASSCSGNFSESCKGCGLYSLHSSK